MKPLLNLWQKTQRNIQDYEITDDFLKRVEKQIHEAPQYYLWTHKRWKHRNKNKTTAS